MAAVVSTPFATFVTSLQAFTVGAGGVNQSASLTATVHVTQGWSLQMAIQFSHSTVSADPVINIFRSVDGGVTFDSNPFIAFALPRTPTGPGGRQSSLDLATGQYCIQMLNSGPNSAVFGIPTGAMITAVVNL